VKFNKWVSSIQVPVSVSARIKPQVQVLAQTYVPKRTPGYPSSKMFRYVFLVALGLAASVSVTAALGMNPEAELLATPSNFANATARHGLVDSRSLEARQGFCDSGYFPCCE
jgi:hypothetical protein